VEKVKAIREYIRTHKAALQAAGIMVGEEGQSREAFYADLAHCEHPERYGVVCVRCGDVDDRVQEGRKDVESFEELVAYLNSLDSEEVLHNDAVGDEALAQVMTWGFGGKTNVTFRRTEPSRLQRIPTREE